MRKIKIQSILAAIAGLLLATGCSSSFLDTDPTDAFRKSTCARKCSGTCEWCLV